MTSTFVVRVLDADGHLLGWGRHTVRATWRDGGAVFATEAHLPIERDGVAVALSVQWTDLGVARQMALVPTAVTMGAVLQIDDLVYWSILHDATAPLPAVTARGAVIAVPTGGSAATGRPH